MNKLTELMKSRKFWGLAVGLVFDVAGFMTGTIDANVAMAGGVALIGLWQQAQAKVDDSYFVDVPGADGEKIYDAIMRSIPKPKRCIAPGEEFTRIYVIKTVDLPQVNADGIPILLHPEE